VRLRATLVQVADHLDERALDQQPAEQPEHERDEPRPGRRVPRRKGVGERDDREHEACDDDRAAQQPPVDGERVGENAGDRHARDSRRL